MTQVEELLFPQPQVAPNPVPVQSKSAAVAAASTVLTFAANPTAGNMLIGFVCGAGGTVSISSGDTWIPVDPQQNNATLGQGLRLFYVPHTVGGASAAAVTCAAAGSSFTLAAVVEVSGFTDPVPELDGTGGLNGAYRSDTVASTNPTSPTLTNKNAAAYFFAGCMEATTVSSVQAPWTRREQFGSHAVADYVVTTIASRGCTFNTGNGTHNLFTVVFSERSLTPNPATNPWVALWDLKGGMAPVYNGAWAAGTYQPGQIVIDNGIEYMCVRQTTKRPTAWPLSPSAATYGTSLPTSPADGQEAVLVDSVTNPTYQWRFRFNAGSTSAYKWEFIGGFPYTVYQTSALSSFNATTYTAVPMAVPTFPRAGDYQIEWGARFQAFGTAQTDAFLSPNTGAVAQFSTATGAVTYGAASISDRALYAAQAAAATLTLYARAGASGGNWDINYGWMSMLPKRVA